MRLVVDANVVISALASSGVTRKVFLLWLLTALFFSGDPDLREIKEVKVYSPRELLDILLGKRRE